MAAQTKLEALAAAFPLHAQRIAELAHEFDPFNAGDFLQSELDEFGPRWALYNAFDWGSTVEGAWYWSKLADGAR